MFTRRTLLCTSAVSALASSPARARSQSPWQSLWNGVDLKGWSTWGGIPHKSRVGLQLMQNADGTYAEPLGENQDARGVYSVVMHQQHPALRISGEIFGALTTTASFSNYHLLVKWCWGQAQWEPRATGPRDSGILIHATGEHGASGPSRNWMRSVECQIQEGDCGDLWSVGGVHMKVPARASNVDGASTLRFDANAPLVAVPIGDPKREPRVRRGTNTERVSGRWNVTEILVRDNSATFKVNGQTVMSFHEAQTLDAGVMRPLTRGRIQLQSEGAEIYFADVKLRSL